jgi:hypothetical protein
MPVNDIPVMMDEDFQVPNLRFAWDRDLRPLVNQQFANWNMAMEVVDLPIRNGNFPVRKL